ncbi:MAG: hypothetical protein N2B60_02115 [Psychrobacter sp.]
MRNRTHPIQYQLRLSKDMHQWLKTNAFNNHRSLLGEINMHLEHARDRIENQSGTKKADTTRQDELSASTTFNSERN